MRSTARPASGSPNLEYCRKQARALLQAHAARKTEAAHRLREHHPRLAGLPDPEIFAAPLALHDMLLVVAREQGFASWPRLREHVRLAGSGRLERAEAFVRAACSDNVAAARELLAADPLLARAGLAAACAAGEAATLARMLREDPSRATAAAGPLGWAPLLYVCYSRFLRDPARRPGLVRCAGLLLDGGADPDARWRDPEGRQPSGSALYGATGVNNAPKLARLLLDRGADPDDGESLYHSAEFSDHDCLRLLLERGARIEGTNAVHRKLDFEDPEGLRLFLEHGADPNLRGALRSATLLHWAVSNGRSPAVLELLLAAGADPNARSGEGITPYQFACRLGHVEAAELLRRHGAGAELSPTEEFLAACARADEPAVRDTLARQPDLVRRLTPHDLGLLTNVAWRGNTRAVRLMLQAGFDPAARGGNGETALHCAAWRGDAGTARVLLEASAPLEVRDSAYRATPLGWAVHGAVHAVDREGRPLNDQADYEAVVEALLDAGASTASLAPGPTGHAAVDALLRPREGAAPA